ncbi:MAG: glycosyltransferase family 2 protein [Chthoniobacterales bacterium]
MNDITALILTFNEAPNIERTLHALQWVDRVLIVDSFSNDETGTIARATRPDVRIEQNPFQSFAEQCNFGLTRIETPWVLSIDADYVLTPELIAELRELEPPKEIGGYSAAFNYCVFGRRLRYTVYPPRAVLYRRELARYRDEGHGHRVTIKGAVRTLAGKIDHDDRKPLSRWIRSQDRYAIVEARHLLSSARSALNPQDRLRKRIYFAPVGMFLYLLLGRGLIFNGWPGWYYVCQRTIAEMLLSLRLLTEREKLEEKDKVDSRK